MLKFGGRRRKLRVVFMGSAEFSVPSLERLVLDGYEVVAVYTQPDRPVGRGLSPAASPVKKAALTLGLPVVQPSSLKPAEAVAQLAGFRPDIIVVAAFGQILPQSVLDIPVHGCINVHPSLLPKYRGASPVAAAILAGDEFTGVSIMLMDKGLDSGPVLARGQIPIAAYDTTGSLTAKLSIVAAQLLQEVLVHWLRGELVPQPQNEAEATYSSLISKEEGEIDWRLPALSLWRRVRAFQSWPGSYTRWWGKQLRIIEAVPLVKRGDFAVGQVLALSPDVEHQEATFGVQTGDGILGVLQVQLEGKRAMLAAEFLRGQRQFIGGILPSS
jgi:methionyl-tRNA formyltransferase